MDGVSNSVGHWSISKQIAYIYLIYTYILSQYIYIYMYMYVCVYIHVDIYVHVHVYIYTMDWTCRLRSASYLNARILRWKRERLGQSNGTSDLTKWSDQSHLQLSKANWAIHIFLKPVRTVWSVPEASLSVSECTRPCWSLPESPRASR